MAFNINGYNSQPTVTKNDRLQRNTDDQKVSSSIDAPERGGVLADDTVNLSSAAQTLQNQKSKIDSLPDIDMAKVEQIKKAIEAGDYKVDTEKLANNMMAMDSIFQPYR